MELVPRPERLGDAPGLRDAPAGSEGRIGVEDLGDRADPKVAEMVGERRQERQRGRGVAVGLEVGEREGAEKPGPDRALMVRTVACALIAAVVAPIVGIARSEATQPERRQEVARAGVDDALLALRSQRALEERDGENLVWPERGVVPSRSIEYVVAAVEVVVPEPSESRLHPLGERVPRRRRSAQALGEPRHRPERVVPEGVDLDRFAGTWRDDPVADPRVHPRA